MSAPSGGSYPGVPPAPPSATGYLDSLAAEQHAGPIAWLREAVADDELDCRAGLRLTGELPFNSPDAENALQDFACFCDCAGIPADRGCPLYITTGDVGGCEAFRIEVRPEGCTLALADAAALRRALVWMEDEMLRWDGPFLPLGGVVRQPALRTRMLMEVGLFHDTHPDGLPDTYLNRIAHCGVNSLVLPLPRLYPGRIVPEFDPAPATLFEQLRTRVARYARYGIRLFVYLIEPHAATSGGEVVPYCTSRPEALADVERAVTTLFRAVPGLGGLVLICVGERPSHCFSMAPPNDILPSTCPRCAERDANEVLAELLATVEHGMHAVAPDAELVAWPYMQSTVWGEPATIDFAPHTPAGVALMHNMEQGGRVGQLGKLRRTDDYWLAYAGPSELFTACARAATGAGRDMYAKLAVTCGHEVASVPYIPVPGILYRKFRGMRDTGCCGAFMNWGSGNAPSVMLRATGELAADPLPETEEAFLLELARHDWAECAPAVAHAWKAFSDAYENVPATIGFSYFGPLHNGATWPLYLEPADLTLPRNWMADDASGDRMGDCLGYHGLEETITLCRRMLERWREGSALMAGLVERFRDEPDRRLDIAIAMALEVQIESAVNILTFYALREQLADGGEPRGQALLDRMRRLVKAEKETAARLCELCDEFPELGFCLEAGTYKYFPAKLRWRIGVLDRLLNDAFPRVEDRLAAGKPAFERHAGVAPGGPQLIAPKLDGEAGTAAVWRGAVDTGDFAAPSPRSTRCAAAWDDEAVYLRVTCAEPDRTRVRAEELDRTVILKDDHVWVTVEADALCEGMKFKVNTRGAREFVPILPMNVCPIVKDWAPPRAVRPEACYAWTADVEWTRDGWTVLLRLPFAFLRERGFRGDVLRVNVGRRAVSSGAVEQFVWAPARPARDGRTAPAHYGRLILEDA